MMDWEVEKWKQRLAVVITELVQNKSKQIDFTNDDVCPANIVKVLENMGWEYDEQEDNGWQHDTWICLAHENYNFCLILYYQGYTFELKLYRSDIDN